MLLGRVLPGRDGGRYLMVLHLWALFILAFHTHRLDHPSNSGVATPPFVQSRS